MSLYQLSFLGDAVFELMVREYLINKNVLKLKELQECTLNFVTAKRQAYFADKLVSLEFLNSDEINILRKGRNLKTRKSPKNCDAVTYKYSTAFEILIGYLYINNKKRLDEVFEFIINL